MDQLPVFLVAVFGLGLAAQWLAWRLRLPAILLLLVLGFGSGWYFGDPEQLLGRDLLFAVVSLSVAVILFEGGLSLRLAEIRETGRVVVALVTVGIAVTWLLTTLSAAWVLGFCWPMAFLLGALLVVSGPTVVIPLLRHVRPNRRVGAIAKWEGIVNDPIGAILAVIILVAIVSGDSPYPGPGNLVALVVFLAVGAAIGTVVALVIIELLRRYWIPDYLQNLALLTAVVISFLVSNMLRQESGLMAVTVLGVVLANQKRVSIQHVVEFKENLRVLLISWLFIVLAARIDPAVLIELGVPGAIFLALLILVIRPMAVWVSCIGSRLTLTERGFLAWLHPRGIVAAAVSSIFALELAHLHHLPEEILADAERLVPVTFLVIVGTVTVYGLTVGPFARWLKVAEANPQGILFAGADALVREIAIAVQKEGFHVLVVDLNKQNVAAARMAGLSTCWANICSEYALEGLDLGGIGRLLAMTPNDEINSLAAQEFVELFGRAEVYQLAHQETEIKSLERLRPQLSGRMLFGPDASHANLTARLAAGAVVKTTGLTDEFDYNDFLRLYGSSAIVLMIVGSTRSLKVVTGENSLSPQPGQKLIALVEPQAPPRAAVPGSPSIE